MPSNQRRIIATLFYLLSLPQTIRRGFAYQVITEYGEEGTPFWRYVDESFFNVGGDQKDSRRLHESKTGRDLQSTDDCEGFPDEWDQEVYVTIYDVAREMNEKEVKEFERIVLSTWASNNCFSDPCLRIDSFSLEEQGLDNNFDCDHSGRALESHEWRNVNDHGRRLRHRKRNITKNKAKGRCRRCNKRKAIKAEDRRLLEDSALIEVEVEAEVDGNLDITGRGRRRLFACEEQISEELLETGMGAFDCNTKVEVTLIDPRLCIDPSCYSSSSKSRSSR